MRKITGNVFGDDVNYFVLNEGLEELGVKALIASKQDELYIPSTLSKVDYYAMNFRYLKKVEFCNFKKSKLLQNDEELMQFLSHFFYIDIKEIERNSENRNFYKKLNNKSFPFVNKFTIKTRLETLTLYDDGKIYSIDLDKLSFKTDFYYPKYNNNNINQIEVGMLFDDDLTKLVRLLKEEIYNVTGYSLKNDNKVIKLAK